jgi:lysophospholipase L1-like esterase
MPKKTAAAILMFAAIVFGLQYVPAGFKLKLERYDVARAVEFRPPGLPVATATTATRHVLVTLPSNGHNGPNTIADPKVLIDPNGTLNTFYQALLRTESKMPGAITRVLHYGDSPVTADSITADARSSLQQRFGDAGHGFVLIAKPWAWYGHRGIRLKARGWRIEAASQSRAHDGLHGLGGVSFTGGPSAWSTIELPDDQHTSMEVLYERQPGGGTFAVTTETASLGEVQTAADSKIPGFASFKLPPETSEVTLKVMSGSVRVFGWSFEKEKPGIVYDSLGVNGGQVQMALRYFEASQWAAEMQHEHPDLVVINYGTNESVFPDYIERYYEKELRSLVERVRASLPHVSLLIMSPMDRGVRDSGGQIVTPDVLPRIVEIQAKVAMDMGCAFFNTFEAMGGAGTMAKWYTSQPRMVSSDFMHPLPGGAKIVGQLLSTAICDGFEKFKKSHMLAGSNGHDL